MDFVDALLLFGLHASEAGNLQKKKKTARQISKIKRMNLDTLPTCCLAVVGNVIYFAF